MSVPVLSIVVPCFNEEEALPETVMRLTELVKRLVAANTIHRDSGLWLIDDGSTDRTWQLIEQAQMHTGSRVHGIKLSRNQGHQVALMAGLMNARGDVLISIDADLQDDLEVIPQMLEQHAKGHDIVYGVRNDRTTDTAFKRITAESYYSVLQRFGVDVIPNHADYRLMSRRSIEALRCYSESNLFLRGLIPQLGFPSTQVEYARGERMAGVSKYPLSKMLSLAWQGITSFSTTPLRLITTLGITVSVISIGMGIWAFGVRLLTDQAIPGWASIVIPLLLLSGVQMLSLGVIGEYIAKIFLETKRRPLYFIEKVAEPEMRANALRELA